MRIFKSSVIYTFWWLRKANLCWHISIPRTNNIKNICVYKTQTGVIGMIRPLKRKVYKNRTKKKFKKPTVILDFWNVSILIIPQLLSHIIKWKIRQQRKLRIQFFFHDGKISVVFGPKTYIQKRTLTTKSFYLFYHCHK